MRSLSKQLADYLPSWDEKNILGYTYFLRYCQLLESCFWKTITSSYKGAAGKSAD